MNRWKYRIACCLRSGTSASVYPAENIASDTVLAEILNEVKEKAPEMMRTVKA
jgi:hypothetical protein